MSTDRPACGLTSLLPDCRGRAEAFARRLQSRLQTLGHPTDGEDANIADESSWLAPRNVTTTQPRLSSSSDSDLYFDFDVEPRSPASPVEIPSTTEPLVNHSKISSANNRDPESGCVVSSSSLSPGSENSDGPYFDLETTDRAEYPHNRSCKHFALSNKCNGYTNLRDANTSFDAKNSINSSNSSVQKDVNNLLNGEQSKEAASENHVEPPDLASSIDVQEKVAEDSSHSNGILNEQSGSYCSTFCRPSDLLIEYPVQCSADQEICNLVPVALEDDSSSTELSEVLLETTDISNDAEENGVEDTTDACPRLRSFSESPNCSVANIKELLKQGYLMDTGQDDEDAEDSSTDCVENLIQEGGEEGRTSENLLTIDILSLDVEQNDENTISEVCNREDAIAVSEIEVTTDQVVPASERKASRSNDTDDDEDDSAPQRVRRCTSLKTGKTPPGTPGRKKIVRFADVLGLDLADVRTFLDEVPRVPSSAYKDLQNADLTLGSSAMPVLGSASSKAVPTEPTKCLVPLFQQPGGQPDFLERVKQRQVCLENAVVKDPVMFRIEGTVRVRNLDFHKSVHIRYTLDGWMTFADLQASYIQNSCDGFSDKFSFVLYAHTLVIGQRLEIAVRFQCKGSQFWDNNQGANYTFQCLPPASSTPFLPLAISSPEDHWATFY